MQYSTFRGIYPIIIRQLSSLWPLDGAEEEALKAVLPECIEKTNRCIGKYKNNQRLSILRTTHYCILLHYLREMLTVSHGETADKIFALTKTLHGVDFYSAIFPKHIYFEHPNGSVIGRATLGDCLTVYQGVTIGGSFAAQGELNYPTIGDNVILYANTSVVGNSSIGSCSVLSLGAAVINEPVPPNSIVFGASPKLTIKKLSVERLHTLSPFSYN